MTAPNQEPEKKKDVLRETDDTARRLAKDLIRTARYGALAVLEPGSGHPMASRVALATDIDGTPVILTSTLSGHTAAILTDPRSSLLIGEPGKGDPLAHARITLFTQARRIERGSDDHARLRRRYLARQPKAELYVDFGDFAFFRLDMARASLNGGFGKAYDLQSGDLALQGDWLQFADMEAGAVAHMNEDHGDAVKLYAEVLCGAGPANWRLATLDPEGMDLVAGDEVRRLWFDEPLQAPDQVRGVLVDLAKKARA